MCVCVSYEYFSTQPLKTTFSMHCKNLCLYQNDILNACILKYSNVRDPKQMSEIVSSFGIYGDTYPKRICIVNSKNVRKRY